ncbi:MAG: NAD(+) synthase [Parcubacteria group bacterium]|nr:NAD(+) synthase [Parcubacteria group bacterium]
MRLIKIGIGTINTTVGAFTSNTKTLIDKAREMSNAECTVGVFQEQVIGGYPAEDLVQWPSFVSGQWDALVTFANATWGFQFPTVFVVGMVVVYDGQPYNAAAVVSAGKIWGIVPKEKLPTYGVFYEGRVFTPGMPGLLGEVNGVPFGDLLFKTPFGVFAVEVCEDIWTPDGPMRRRSFAGAELVLNLSASPFRIGVVQTRREMIATRAADNQVTIVYANQVGGNDALVFDGGGFVNQNGTMLFDAPRWREGIATQVVDLDRTARHRVENTTWRRDREAYRARAEAPAPTEVVVVTSAHPNQSAYKYPVPTSKNFFLPNFAGGNSREQFFGDLIEAMIMGLDYFSKTHAFRTIGIALSGGKDSALSLIIAWFYALRRFEGDKDRVRSFIRCFSMPTRFNSEETKSIASRLADELGVSFKEESIEEAFVRECEAAKAMLAPGEEVTALTKQNIQARIRAERMWNWANSAGGLVLQMSNMSEKAVGYTTVGGDLSGGYSLIGNVPKTIVIELLRYIGERHHIAIAKELLATKASAELARGQADEDDLMPFPVLDACFALFAGEKMSPKEIYSVLRSTWTDEELLKMASRYAPGMLKEWVKRFVTLFSRAIFKWEQAPQSVHLGTLDLDRKRALQIPVVHSTEWLERSLQEIDDL